MDARIPSPAPPHSYFLPGEGSHIHRNLPRSGIRKHIPAEASAAQQPRQKRSPLALLFSSSHTERDCDQTCSFSHRCISQPSLALKIRRKYEIHYTAMIMDSADFSCTAGSLKPFRLSVTIRHGCCRRTTFRNRLQLFCEDITRQVESRYSHDSFGTAS